MKTHLLYSFLIVGCIIFSSCSIKLANKHIKRNKETGLYEYKPNKRKPGLKLRDDKGLLVEEENIENFEEELNGRRNMYPLKGRKENPSYLKNTDQQVLAQYNLIGQKLNRGEYQEAFQLSEKFSKIPNVYNYTDLTFLQAFALEKLGDKQNAKEKYTQFLAFSSGKYSGRFRGYQYADIDDKIFIKERNHAVNYLSGNVSLEVDSLFPKIEPKFHYNSFFPGYGSNLEDNSNSSNFFYFFIESGLENQLGFQIGTYHTIAPKIDITPSVIFSRNYLQVETGFPLKVYKSYNNDLGVKVTPFIGYYRFDSLLVDTDNPVQVSSGFLSGGVQFSAAKYLSQKFTIGGFFTYNIHNENNPYLFKNVNVNVWRENEFDLSLYYNILQGISLKGGIRNGGSAIGFYIRGMELSIDPIRGRFYFTSTLY